MTSEPFHAGTVCTLDEHAARHMRVLRLEAGAPVALRDGNGLVGEAQVVRLARHQVQVEVAQVELVAPLPAVHLLVPVADRDRLLWLAEKASELGCTSWRPVLWRRSRSVAPRGEGMGFQAKVRARMVAAMAQAEQAWLPQLFPEANVERAVLAAPEGDRVVAAPAGTPFVGPAALPIRAPVVIAIGPEGGLEADELATLEAAGFRRVGLGPGILRFETAAVAALSMARTSLGGAPPAADVAPTPHPGVRS